MAVEAYRASDVARICDDNKVAGLERDTVAQHPPRPLDLDQVSLIKQIDKLKLEFGVKPAGEPEDSLDTWMQSDVVAPDLEFFSPFSQSEARGPARGTSQGWQREHLRSSDPRKRELEEVFEEPSSPRSRSNWPQQHPSRPPSFKSVFEQRNLQQPQPSQPRSRAALSRPQASRSQSSGSQPSGSQSFQSQWQQWQQRPRPSQSRSGSQLSRSQPSGPRPSQSPLSRSQPSGSQPSRSQLSQSPPSQSPPSQPPPSQSQPQRSQQQQQPMQYKPAPQQRYRQRQRTNSWPRNQERQSFAAQSLAYVPEVPREESAPSVNRNTVAFELDELPNRSSKGKDKSGQAEPGQNAANDAESDKDKNFCSIRGHCVISPFPGWKTWFSRKGDDNGPTS